MILTRVFEAREGALLWVNVLPVGEFHDPRYGVVKITQEMVKQMEENFRKGIPHYEPVVNISHEDNLGAYGVVKALEAREDGLWALLELTEEGAKLVREQKFRYLSAEFTEEYMDKQTGKDVGCVFLGVALTNRPAHPKMQPISLQEGESMEYKLTVTDTPDNWPLDADSPWDWDWADDANKIIEKYGWEGLAKCCAYVDTENFERGESGWPENKSAYKLPFAKIKGDRLTIFWSGVRAAMAALLGARGGVDIPRDEKKRVYNKLASLYKKFDKEPPEFHFEEEVDSVKLEEYESKIKTLEEELAKEKAEKEKLTEEVKKLAEELEQAKKAKLENELELWKRDWVSKGAAPAVVEDLKKMLLEDPTKREQFDSLLSKIANPALLRQMSEEKEQDYAEKAREVVKRVFGGG
ncbi:MAG: phage protease [Candidatus Methanosuratincola sp.]